MSTHSVGSLDREPHLVGMWLWFIGLAFWSRLFILGFWIFGSTLGNAFDHGWVVPAIGFVIAPNTTFAFAWMWGLTSDGVNGWEWIVVAIGVLFDVWMYGAWQRIRVGG